MIILLGTFEFISTFCREQKKKKNGICVRHFKFPSFYEIL
jgi:hypothetical protein